MAFSSEHAILFKLHQHVDRYTYLSNNVWEDLDIRCPHQQW